MIMDRKDKLSILKDLEKYVKKSTKLVDSLLKQGYAVESPIVDTIDCLENQALWMAEKVVGDLPVPHNGGWITWHIYENDFGKKKLEAGYDKNLKPICNWNDVLDLIEEGNKRK
jgi:hypothetical protein